MKRQLAVILIAVLVVSGISTAATVGTNSFADDFDDGSLTEYTITDNEAGTVTEAEVDSSRFVSRPYSFHLDVYSQLNGDPCPRIRADAVDTFSLPNVTNVTFQFQGVGADTPTDGAADQEVFIRINDSTGDWVGVEFRTATGTGSLETNIQGSIVNGATTSVHDYDGKWTEITLTVDRDSGNLTLYRNGSSIATSTLSSSFTDPGNVSVEFVGGNPDWTNCDPGGTGEFRIQSWWDDVEVSGFETVESTSIELEVTKAYMDHGSQQDYSVKLVETDLDTGEETVTDITDDANTSVVSGDTDLVTVDENLNSLHATTDETSSGQAVITANYTDSSGDVHQDTVTITVANKSLDNLAILPPPTWPSALFGSPGSTTGETGTWPGAVQLQWLFVSFVIGAIISHITNNSFIGVATVPMMLALGWAINWVSDAILVLSIAFLLWIAISRGFGEVDPRAFAGK